MAYEIVDGIVVETIVEMGVQVERRYSQQNLEDNIQAITEQEAEAATRKAYFQEMLDALIDSLNL